MHNIINVPILPLWRDPALHPELNPGHTPSTASKRPLSSAAPKATPSPHGTASGDNGSSSDNRPHVSGSGNGDAFAHPTETTPAAPSASSSSSGTNTNTGRATHTETPNQSANGDKGEQVCPLFRRIAVWSFPLNYDTFFLLFSIEAAVRQRSLPTRYHQSTDSHVACFQP